MTILRKNVLTIYGVHRKEIFIKVQFYLIRTGHTPPQNCRVGRKKFQKCLYIGQGQKKFDFGRGKLSYVGVSFFRRGSKKF